MVVPCLITAYFTKILISLLRGVFPYTSIFPANRSMKATRSTNNRYSQLDAAVDGVDTFFHLVSLFDVFHEQHCDRLLERWLLRQETGRPFAELDDGSSELEFVHANRAGKDLKDLSAICCCVGSADSWAVFKTNNISVTQTPEADGGKWLLLRK